MSCTSTQYQDSCEPCIDAGCTWCSTHSLCVYNSADCGGGTSVSGSCDAAAIVGAVFGVIGAIVFIAVIICLVCYFKKIGCYAYRRRINGLSQPMVPATYVQQQQQQIQPVTYIQQQPQPQPQPQIIYVQQPQPVVIPQQQVQQQQLPVYQPPPTQPQPTMQ